MRKPHISDATAMEEWQESRDARPQPSSARDPGYQRQHTTPPNNIAHICHMDPELFAVWISDQRVQLCACSEPVTCLQPPRHSTPPYRRQRSDVFDEVSTTAKRPRFTLAEIEPNLVRRMPNSDKHDLRRSPRKNEKQRGHEDMLESGNAMPAHGTDLQATPRPWSHKQFTQQEPRFPIPMSFTARLNGNDQFAASGSRERSSCASSRTRSTSPVKNPDELLKLEKPVLWMTPDPRTLRDAVKATESAQALQLFDDVWKVIQGEGYLPRELKGILKDELMVNESRFAANDKCGVFEQKERDEAAQLFPLIGTDEDHMPGLLALYRELRTIREIVATTIRFINTSRSEATWNDHIHGPILRLAVSSNPHVAAENITQASFAKVFVPAARGELEALSSKMIDYAMLLRPERRLAVRIVDFVDGFDGPRTFNQSTHGALCYEPTGVLVETKADIRRRAEGKAQLGIWLASWHGRVARFAPLPSADAGTPTKLPFLPVILIVCETWELRAARDRGHCDRRRIVPPTRSATAAGKMGRWRIPWLG